MAKRAIARVIQFSVPAALSRGFSTVTATTNSTTSTNNNGNISDLKRRLLGNTTNTNTSDADTTETLNEWVKEGNPVMKFEIIRLVDEFRKCKRYNHAIQMIEWLEKMGWDLSHGDHAVRLDLISKTQGVDSAQLYFTSLPESAKNKLTYEALLNCYSEKKMTDKATDLIKKMSEKNLDSSCLTYNNIISLHMRTGEPEKVPQLVQEMKEKSITPDLHTYNLLINSYASLNDIEAAERVLEEMKAGGVKCGWSTYANLASIYIEAGLFDKADLALIEVEKMSDLRRKAYHMLLSLYSHTSNKSGVDRVWESLKSAFPEPVNLSYLNMLQALVKLGDTDRLQKYFEEWESCCSNYDMRVANVLIGFYLNQDMLKGAELIFEGATKRGAKPNFRTLEMFMNFYLQKRQMDLALKNLDAACSKSKDEEWQPSKETVSMFCEYFEQEKNIDSAEKLYQSLQKVFCVDSNVYASLLRTYIAADKSEAQMLQRVNDDGIEMDSEIKQLLEKVCPN